MKRNLHRFRPRVAEMLEERTVPSGLDPLIGRVIAALPARDARAVLREFQRFERLFVQEVRETLAPEGTSNPEENRDEFDAVIAAALEALSGAIAQELADLPTGDELAEQIQERLIGSGAGQAQSLQEQLTEIVSPTTADRRGLRRFVNQGTEAIDRVARAVASQIARAPAPANAISTSVVQKVLRDVRAGLRTFHKAYAQAIRGVLLPRGTTDPSVNRPAFDEKVAEALATLDGAIGTALEPLPGSVKDPLKAKVTKRLLTWDEPTGRSLRERLEALRTPRRVRGLSAAWFRARSSLLIRTNEAQIVRLILAAVRDYNTSPVVTP